MPASRPEAGERYRQTETGFERVWEVLRVRDARISIQVISTTADGDAWQPGRSTNISIEWLRGATIRQIPAAIDPPTGSGLQTVSVAFGGDPILRQVDEPAADMIAWLLAQCDGNDSATVQWWGYGADPGDDPDMTATWDGTDLTWAEAHN